jgi:hypothetical protein
MVPHIFCAGADGQVHPRLLEYFSFKQFDGADKDLPRYRLLRLL